MTDDKSGGAGNTSKTLVGKGFGGVDMMVVEERPIPTPGKGELLINIKASGLNFAELMARQGLYDGSPKVPYVLGLEGAGVVVEFGPDITTNLKKGARVMVIRRFGIWAEFVTVPEDQCFEMPDGMTFEEAAAIPINYITAYHMLFDMAGLRKGQSVLVHMVAGGVGCAATQLCRTVPDVTIFGTCSASKHEAVSAQGVDHPIDYRTKDYVKEVREISPKGVDIVLDPLSGADAVKGFELLKPLGKIIHFGAANITVGPTRSYWQIIKTYMSTKNYNPLFMMKKNRGAFGYHLGHLLDAPEVVREAAIDLVQMYKDRLIKPVIDSVWSFEDAGKAMSRMHDRLNIGKVILTPHKPPEKVQI